MATPTKANITTTRLTDFIVCSFPQILLGGQKSAIILGVLCKAETANNVDWVPVWQYDEAREEVVGGEEYMAHTVQAKNP